MLMLTAAKLLFSWWPGVLDLGTWGAQEGIESLLMADIGNKNKNKHAQTAGCWIKNCSLLPRTLTYVGKRSVEQFCPHCRYSILVFKCSYQGCMQFRYRYVLVRSGIFGPDPTICKICKTILIISNDNFKFFTQRILIIELICFVFIEKMLSCFYLMYVGSTATRKIFFLNISMQMTIDLTV